MSSDTNNLSDIMFNFSWDTHLVKVENHAGKITDEQASEKYTKLYDEAIAAVLALLPENNTAFRTNEHSKPYCNGYRAAIDQTRRNLIGEQHGDSNSPSGDTEPLSNQVMPEAPASGEEQ